MTNVQAKSQSASATQVAVDNEIDFLAYFRVIWRRRRMVFVLCVFVMAVTVILSLRKPRQYQSAVTIVPPLDILRKESAGGLGAMNNPLLRQVMDTAASSIVKTYVEILESREVADAIIDRFRLMEVYDRIRYRSDVRQQLKHNTITKTTKGGAVRVEVVDRDPNRAAAIANAYVEELDKQNKRLSTGQATSKRVFLETQLKEVEARLSKIDNILSREAKTQEMLYALLVEQHEVAKMEEAMSMPTIQVLDSAVVPELPMGRGTVKKGVVAGVAAFLFGILLAFSREYVAQARRREAEALTARTHGSEDLSSGASSGRTAEPRPAAGSAG